MPHDDFDDEIDEEGLDPDEALLVAFLNDWENPPDFDGKEAILKDYCAKHPRLERQFRSLAEARRSLGAGVFVGDPEPRRLGPYRILRFLAKGGMGKVYVAEDETLSRLVAVKTIRVGRAADPKLLEQFKAEREALALLHDTNIVPIFSAGEEDGLFYFAMPLIHGITLADLVETMILPGSPDPKAAAPPASTSSWVDLLRRARSDASHRHTIERLSTRYGVRFTRDSSSSSSDRPDSRTGKHPSNPRPPDYERRVVEIVAVAAEAIHNAHEAGVLHLDVKPSNILVEPGSKADPATLHPWVIDFGLVGVVESRDGREDGPAGSAERLRQTRGFGTKGFMAPEMIVIRGDERNPVPPSSAGRPPITRSADIWSLGVTLYQMLTLHLPFSSNQQTLGPEPAPSPRRLVATLSAELEAIVLKALQKRPEERYATAAEFARDLRRWLTGFPTVAGKASPGKRLVMWARRKPAIAVAAGMTAAFALMSGLGAAQAFQTLQAEAATAQRELDLIALAHLSAPIRTGGLVRHRLDQDPRGRGRSNRQGRQLSGTARGLTGRARRSPGEVVPEARRDPGFRPQNEAVADGPRRSGAGRSRPDPPRPGRPGRSERPDGNHHAEPRRRGLPGRRASVSRRG